MKYAPSPSVPSRSVRVAMPIMAMRTKPLPPRNPDEVRRLLALVRKSLYHGGPDD